MDKNHNIDAADSDNIFSNMIKGTYVLITPLMINTNTIKFQ